jgi:hypothetical protein
MSSWREQRYNHVELSHNTREQAEGWKAGAVSTGFQLGLGLEPHLRPGDHPKAALPSNSGSMKPTSRYDYFLTHQEAKSSKG